MLNIFCHLLNWTALFGRLGRVLTIGQTWKTLTLLWAQYFVYVIPIWNNDWHPGPKVSDGLRGHQCEDGDDFFLRQTKMHRTLRPRRNRRHFADAIFKCICLNENVWISIKISLKFIPKGPINNIPTLVQIMAWRRPGDKPLSEPMMISSLTHICVARPQWVNKHKAISPKL